jgi:hypothetical protein
VTLPSCKQLDLSKHLSCRANLLRPDWVVNTVVPYCWCSKVFANHQVSEMVRKEAVRCQLTQLASVLLQTLLWPHCCCCCCCGVLQGVEMVYEEAVHAQVTQF